jgi:hypothetical protein
LAPGTWLQNIRRKDPVMRNQWVLGEKGKKYVSNIFCLEILLAPMQELCRTIYGVKTQCYFYIYMVMIGQKFKKLRQIQMPKYGQINYISENMAEKH